MNVANVCRSRRLPDLPEVRQVKADGIGSESDSDSGRSSIRSVRTSQRRTAPGAPGAHRASCAPHVSPANHADGSCSHRTFVPSGRPPPTSRSSTVGTFEVLQGQSGLPQGRRQYVPGAGKELPHRRVRQAVGDGIALSARLDQAGPLHDGQVLGQRGRLESDLLQQAG